MVEGGSSKVNLVQRLMHRLMHRRRVMEIRSGKAPGRRPPAARGSTAMLAADLRAAMRITRATGRTIAGMVATQMRTATVAVSRAVRAVAMPF